MGKSSEQPDNMPLFGHYYLDHTQSIDHIQSHKALPSSLNILLKLYFTYAYGLMEFHIGW
jgi:hypothetical protein